MKTTIDSARRVLQENFRLEQFRFPQAEVIERTLAGGHSLVILPTGGGKSLCFQIPAILLAKKHADGSAGANVRRPLTVVLSPLISLMKDQVDRLTERGVSATFVNSSLDRQQRESRYEQLRNGRFDLLYVTPERFRKAEFLEALAQREVVLLAIDEAHCISQWGHDFRPDYSGVSRLREVMGKPYDYLLNSHCYSRRTKRHSGPSWVGWFWQRVN